VGILEGKNILVAGVTLDTSIGFHVAKVAQAEGATVLVSNFGRAMSLTGRVIKKLDPVPDVLDMDVNNDEQIGVSIPEQLELASFNDWPSMMLRRPWRPAGLGRSRRP